MKKVLIVVDMQNDFITGSLGSEQAKAIVPNVKKKIEEYCDNGDIVIFTRDTHYENYLDTQEGKNLPVIHCIYGTDGWQIYDSMDDMCHCCVYINKPSFGWTDWKNTLEKVIDDIDEIELVGLVSSICVVSNALILKAAFPEKKIVVDTSCTAGIEEDDYLASLKVMKMCQINIVNEQEKSK